MSADELKVMTFNVRGFNRTGQLKSPDVFENILKLIENENPDVICFQEFGYFAKKRLDQYPYRNLKYHEDKTLMGIFSKYPIIDADYLNFKDSGNDAEFADLLYKGDTLRIYNIHLESLRLPHHAMQISDQLSEGLYARLSRSFELQQDQAKQFREHKNKNTYRTIVCGDFNNTQFSNVYQVIKGDMQDSFIEKGSGFGRTYQFLRFPLRIDFIMADTSFEVMAHKNFNERLSDHYPVMASFKLKGN
jgi:endonuclease/exonuclease/phosphatase family metal-dependent hydrolase